MEELYKETIEILSNLKAKPTSKQWSSIAKEKGLLTAISLRRISGKDFNALYFQLRKQKEEQLS